MSSPPGLPTISSDVFRASAKRTRVDLSAATPAGDVDLRAVARAAPYCDARWAREGRATETRFGDTGPVEGTDEAIDASNIRSEPAWCCESAVEAANDGCTDDPREDAAIDSSVDSERMHCG